MSERNDPTRLDEAALVEYMKGGSSVSQRYREVANDEVPADLDQRVLEMAHAAAATKKGRERQSRRPGWIAPLALAASAVLVVSIVIESGVYKGEDPVAPPVFAPRRQEAPPADASAELLLRDQVAEPAAAPPAETQIPASAPAPSAARAEKAAQVAVEARRAQQILDETARVRAEEREFAASPPAAAAGEPERAKADIPSVVLDAPSRQNYSSVSSSTEAVDDVDLGEVAVTGVRARRDAAGGRGPRNTVRPASSRGAETADAADAQRTPEEWLEEIRELRRQGRDRDADREWDRFRGAWPEYEVASSDAARPPR